MNRRPHILLTVRSTAVGISSFFAKGRGEKTVWFESIWSDLKSTYWLGWDGMIWVKLSRRYSTNSMHVACLILYSTYIHGIIGHAWLGLVWLGLVFLVWCVGMYVCCIHIYIHTYPTGGCRVDLLHDGLPCYARRFRVVLYELCEVYERNCLYGVYAVLTEAVVRNVLYSTEYGVLTIGSTCVYV